MGAVVRFFDVSPGPEVVNPMFGTAHLVAIVGLLALIPALWLGREWLRQVELGGPFVCGVAAFILLDQLLLFGLFFVADRTSTSK